MSEAISHVEQRCISCGSTYRQPRWGRAYTCGACGQPLRGAPQRVRRAIIFPAWLYYGAGAVMLTALLAWLVTTRQAEQRGARRDMQAAFGLLQQLPPHQEERIRQRLAYLEADRQTDARDPVLLSLVAESYLQLGVLHQRSDTRKSAEELQRCQDLARELVAVSPEMVRMARSLIQQAQAPQALGWTVVASSSNTTREPFIQNDAATRLMGEIPSRMGMPDFPAKTGFRGDRERRDARTDPDSVTPGSLFPTLGRPQTNAPASLPPSGPTGNGRRSFFGNSPSPFEAGSQPPLGPPVEVLRAQVAAHPADARASEALGEQLELEAQIAFNGFGRRVPDQYASARNLSEALEAYTTAATHVRTRLRRAQMLFAGAGVCRKMRDTDAEIRLLRGAADQTPYAPMVWRQLQNALLNKGDFGKAREAWKQYQYWSLPRTRERQL